MVVVVRRRKRRQTYPELLGVGGRWNAETATFLRLLARAPLRYACRTDAQAAWVLRVAA